MTVQLKAHLIDNAYEINHPDRLIHFKSRLSDGKEYRYKRCVQAFESTFWCSETLEKTFQSDSEVSIKECDANSKGIKSNRGRKSKIIVNQVRYLMSSYSALKDIPSEVMNVIEGIARVDWYSRPIENERVVAPLDTIKHSLVPFREVFKECDANSSMVIKGNLSPAGKTRKQYLENLHYKGSADALSVSKMIQCLKKLDEISTINITSILGVGKRQAERYCKALTIAMPYIVLGFVEAYERQAKSWVIRRRKFLSDEGIFISTQHDEEMHLKAKFDDMMVDAMGGVYSNNYNEDIEGVYVPYEGIRIEKFRPNYADEINNEIPETFNIENTMAA